MATTTPNQTPSTTTSDIPPTPACATCSKPQDDTAEKLMRCAGCRDTLYCSRECQKQDWKTHKPACRAKSGGSSTSSKSSSSHNKPNPGFNVMNGIFGSQVDNMLTNLSRHDAMVRLIDCFRMRCEDEYVFAGNNMGAYSGEDPLEDFEDFLDQAQKRAGLLPSWWDKKARRECIALATGGDSWADISCAVEKSDIQEHYNNSMPMMLRILGEEIYGKGFM